MSASRGRLRGGVLQALDEDDVGAIQRWIDYPGSHIEDTDLQTNKTALIYAALVGSTNALKILIQYGASLNASNNVGCTAVFAAAQKGYSSCIQLLCAAAADVNLAMNNGATPLYTACEKGNSACVQLLLDAQAEVNGQREDGATCMYIAAETNRPMCLRLLIEHKADPNKSMHDGCTPLWVAAEQGHKDIVKLITQASPLRRSLRADINVAMHRTGATALFMAAQNGWILLHIAAVTCFDMTAQNYPLSKRISLVLVDGAMPCVIFYRPRRMPAAVIGSRSKLKPHHS
jgi:ankyrin repeat protein